MNLGRKVFVVGASLFLLGLAAWLSFVVGYRWGGVAVLALYPLYRVWTIPSSHQSRACHRCGHRNSRVFVRCPNCGVIL